LMVSFPGERLPGDRRTARDRRATAHRSRAGRRPMRRAAPALRRLALVRLGPIHDPRSVRRDLARNRPGPERPGTPAGRALETVEKLVTARKWVIPDMIRGTCSGVAFVFVRPVASAPIGFCSSTYRAPVPMLPLRGRPEQRR
jgi:hypothetical protein